MNRLLVGLGRGRLVVLLGLIFATFLLVVLPQMGQRSQAYAQAVGTPDTSLTYTPERLYAMLSAYGPIGRQAYLKGRYSYDLAFPLTYGLFLASFVSYSFARTWPDRPDRHRWAGVALGTMVADLVENAALALVILLYPQPALAGAALAAVATLAKWILLSTSILLAATGLLGLLATGLRRRTI
ncbi:MAG TPA: hypothetical protein VGA52_08595 [Anaerolineales bacterium]